MYMAYFRKLAARSLSKASFAVSCRRRQTTDFVFISSSRLVEITVRFCGGDSLRRGAISSVCMHRYLYLCSRMLTVPTWQRKDRGSNPDTADLSRVDML